MTGKAMWGLAAAAAVAFGAFTVTRFPRVGRGTEGTVGAEKDVGLRDGSAQVFLQSGTFAKLLKDPAALKVLSDANLRQQLMVPALVDALKNPDLAAAVRPYGPNCPNGCPFTLQNPEFLSALRNPAIAKALQNPEVIAALQDKAVAAALQKSDVKAASASPAVAAALKNADLAAALRAGGPSGCERCVSVLRKQEFLAALQNPSFANALQNRQVMAALVDPALALVISDARLGAALQSQVFQEALSSNGFSTALHDLRFAQAVTKAAHDANLSGRH